MGSAPLADEGVATNESVMPEMRDVMLMLPTSPGVLARLREAMDWRGVRMGREGCGHAGCGVDMQSEGATGRRWLRRSLGVRMGGGDGAREDARETSDDKVPSEDPEGIAAAQAWMPALSLPAQRPLG